MTHPHTDNGHPSALVALTGAALADASTDALVALARGGDADGVAATFDEIMRRFEPTIYAFVYRIMGDADDAQDMTQQTFVNAYRALPRFGSESRDQNLSAWLHKIASNLCLDVLRRRQRLRWLPWEGPKHDHLLLSAQADDPERATLAAETALLVRRTLAKMGQRSRRLLELREFVGLSCEEIGELMDMTRSAVKSALFRARDEFRRIFAVVERQGAMA